MANWNTDKAKAWLERTGFEHITDGLDGEGRALLASAGECSQTEVAFRDLIDVELWWDESDIEKAVREVTS